MAGLEFLYVGDKGNLEKERVVLRVKESLDLVDYVIINSYSQDGQTCYDLNDKVFWFPPKKVNAGEYIRLYTKAGQKESFQGKFKGEPATLHDFYWNQNSPLWLDKSNAAVILRLQNWHINKI